MGCGIRGLGLTQSFTAHWLVILIKLFQPSWALWDLPLGLWWGQYILYHAWSPSGEPTVEILFRFQGLGLGFPKIS